MDGRLTRRGALRVLSLFAVLLSLVVSGSAQSSSAISGTVKDALGAIIAGAKVVLINEDNKSTRSANANGEGFFYIADIPAGNYDIKVTSKGFESWEATRIEVHPGDKLSVPKINLQPGAVTESVVVTAETAGVSTASGEQSTLITSAQIQRLATVGRDVSELISIIPGFTINGGGDNQGPDYEVTGFGNGNLGAYGALGAAHQSGAVNISSDGANLIDPGDMGGQISNVNMDQVQEVKIQTSNFGADEAKGPVVLNAVGKSGDSNYHGAAYMYLRNYAMNSNDWVTQHLGGARPQTKYFYPGGSFGGPVKIPGTSFNRNKHLLFWAGYEYYGQQIFNGVTTAFVPTARMLGGDLSPDALGAKDALNVNAADLLTNCSNASTQTARYENIGGICVSPGFSNGVAITNPASAPVDPNGNPIMGGLFSTSGIDPGVAAFTRFWPKANHISTVVPATATTSGTASQGYNYVKSIVDPTNGYEIHSRVDYNFSDNMKLYVTYNYEWVNYSTQLNSSWNYQPAANVPLPTPYHSNSGAHTFSGNLMRTLSAAMTNELQASLVYFTEPGQYANRNALLASGSPWSGAGYTGGATGAAMNGFSTTNPAANTAKIGPDQMPELGGWESQNVPGLSEAYTNPKRGQFLNKYSGTVSDNLTKTYRTHSIKVGFYSEITANNSSNLASTTNGTFELMRWSGCLVNQALPSVANMPSPTTSSKPTESVSTGNEIGQFLFGCPLAYSQDLSDPWQNMRFTSIEGYATDEWKVLPKLTLTLGVRLSHIGPWVDRNGVGTAVFEPSLLTPHQLISNLTTDPRSWTGFKWHAIDTSIPVAGVPTRPLFYSPRFSVAYDLHNDGKTVLRGGWGAYRYHDNFGQGASGLQTSQGKQTWTLSNVGTQCSFAQLFSTSVIPCGYYNRSTVSNSVAPFSVSAVDPHDDELPVTYNYNFTLDQALPGRMAFEIGYMGNQSTNLLTGDHTANRNVIPLGAFYGPDPVTQQTNSINNIPNSGNDYRPYPNYAQISVSTHTGWGNYNALQVQLNKQSGSLIYGLNYSWSKNLAVNNSGPDPLDMNHDYGPTSWDRRQVVNLTYSWQEGSKFRGHKILDSALNGWEVSGIASWQSGYDLAAGSIGSIGGSATYSYTPANSTTAQLVNVGIGGSTWLGSSDYTLEPIMKCNPSAGLNKSAHQFVNGNCFGISPQGTQGSWQIPFIPGPAYYKWDMSVFKDFKISDKQTMQFRVDGHNFLNHPLTSFSGKDTSNPLNLSVGQCKPTETAAECTAREANITTLSQALGELYPQTANFGSTNYKAGERILEVALKYNF
jgi:hypothetical protein